ncbi:MAG: GNAT family N-acetyltransferase [Tannerella sp.]|jgi:RimJ/RimL family protein N-acetyltransferase|nr:GNAT family N-acetyltransferase [Tannerella sp.]
MYRVETEHLIITPFAITDSDDFLEFYNQCETMRFISNGKCDWNKGELLGKMENVSGDMPFGTYSVLLKSENKVIGEISVFNSYKDKEKIEIGYILNSKYQKRGFAFEMQKAMIENLKLKFKVKTIVARVNSENISSIKLCLKLGFELKGIDKVDNKTRYTYEI